MTGQTWAPKEILSTGPRVHRDATDVLVILLGLAGRSRESNIILDYGSGNHRRYILVVVSKFAAILNEKQARMTEALLSMHALTAAAVTSQCASLERGS